MSIRFSVLFLFLTTAAVPAIASLPPMEEFGFDPGSDLMTRVRRAPAFALDHINNTIYRRGQCVQYDLNALERERVRVELLFLPPLCKQAVRERVLGIYFLDGMNARGITESVTNRAGKTYWIIYLNHKTILENGSRLLTAKINTAFQRTDSDTELAVDCGPLLTGLSYILLHESAHVADFAYGLTPPGPAALRKKSGRYPITFPVWMEFTKPRPEYDFPERANLAFYGRARGIRPDVSEAPLYLDRISGGPFVSLYAALNWHEDLAELLTFWVLTEKRKTPYVITLKTNGRTVRSVKPMESRRVRDRLSDLKIFYETGDGSRR